MVTMSFDHICNSQCYFLYGSDHHLRYVVKKALSQCEVVTLSITIIALLADSIMGAASQSLHGIEFNVIAGGGGGTSSRGVHHFLPTATFGFAAALLILAEDL